MLCALFVNHSFSEGWVPLWQKIIATKTPRRQGSRKIPHILLLILLLYVTSYVELRLKIIILVLV